MDAEVRARAAGPAATARRGPAAALAPGAAVVLLRPRRLRGTVGLLQRRLPAGWEVEIRTDRGLPMHLTVPEGGLRLR